MEKKNQNLQIPKEKFRLVNHGERISDKTCEDKPIGYLKDAWIRFRKSHAAVVGAIIIILIILFSFLTCGIYSFYWLYKIQNRLNAAGPQYGIHIQEDGTTVLMWLIIGSLLCGLGALYAYHIVFKSANAIGAAYNARLYSNFR